MVGPQSLRQAGTEPGPTPTTPAEGSQTGAEWRTEFPKSRLI